LQGFFFGKGFNRASQLNSEEINSDNGAANVCNLAPIYFSCFPVEIKASPHYNNANHYQFVLDFLMVVSTSLIVPCRHIRDFIYKAKSSLSKKYHGK